MGFDFTFRVCAETAGMKISYYMIMESMRLPHKYIIMNSCSETWFGVANGAYTLSNNSPNS